MPGRYIGVAEVKFHSILTSATHGGEWSASHPGYLYHKSIRTPVTIEDDAQRASKLIWTFG